MTRESVCYPTLEPPERLSRVCRTAQPLAFRPWETVTEETPLNGRWDDDYPAKYAYRVLYTTASDEGAFRETLQDFAPSDKLKAELETVDLNDEEDEDEDDSLDSMGIVPASYFKRRLAHYRIHGDAPCVHICHTKAMDALFSAFSTRFTLDQILGPDRPLTRSLSRKIFNHRDEYAGIAAPSKLGLDVSNFTFFESGHQTNQARAALEVIDCKPISPTDRALFDVVNALGLRLPNVPAEALEPVMESLSDAHDANQS